MKDQKPKGIEIEITANDRKISNKITEVADAVDGLINAVFIFLYLSFLMYNNYFHIPNFDKIALDVFINSWIISRLASYLIKKRVKSWKRKINKVYYL